MDNQLGVVEGHFAEIIWEKEPITTKELINLAKEEFGWARTTTITVIRRLCDKGLFVTENRVVKAVITKSQYSTMHSRQYVNEYYGGSLPRFLVAFTGGEKLKKAEADNLRRIIDEAEE